MARKNTAADSGDEHASGLRLPETYQKHKSFTAPSGIPTAGDTYDKQTTASAAQRPDPSTTIKSTRRVRLLPAVNSLAAHKTPTALYAPASPPSPSRTRTLQSTRATPARSAKTKARPWVVLDSDSDSDQSNGSPSSSSSSSDNEIWADADSSFASPTSSPVRDTKTAQLILDTSVLRLDAAAKENFPPATPPQSPTKSRLVSPSKRAPRPSTPPPATTRPSLDAFWDAAQINAWNSSYSPTKPPSPTKRTLFPSSDTALPASPSKPRPLASPRKPAAETRAFDARKTALATSILAELDAALCAGQIGAATASTGGVALRWSSSLNTTAGRATWKKTRNGGAVAHHATIELATKVLTDEGRLRATLAHEFCHLATYIVDGVTDRPHGREFQAWGRRCKAQLGVQVTTRHDYAVEWKYLWLCGGEECGLEYGRHSRSIDPDKVRCGRCKGTLVQVRPVPRKTKDVGGFAGFVKEEFATVRGEMVKSEGGGKVEHGRVMEELGRRWRARKEKMAVGEGVEVDGGRDTAVVGDGEKDLDDVVKGLEVVVIDD